MAEEDIFEQVPIDLTMTLAEFDERLARGLGDTNQLYESLLSTGAARNHAIIDTGEETLFWLMVALNRLPLTSQQLHFARHCLLAVQSALSGGRRSPLTFEGVKSRSGVKLNEWERIGRFLVAKAVALLRPHFDMDTKAASKRVAQLFNESPERAQRPKVTWQQVRKWFDDCDAEAEDSIDLREATIAGRSMTEAECQVEIRKMAAGSAQLI
ncbi:hypothetical protein H9L12_08380 [Sphingomonas rhizophila]|uniref:Uncharacterized protein n=1 Tax=Sphingomonas rhizophila TaxID=2071607 RepID=A0A7G9S923_9SPHN|nr:hypothetical protein [Sphingomonas rhizophila]QNN64348.1 hypothetical protein H9L12_08380 [Sphingomonas rhizophila]